jgi:uncharacterized membrane protein YGL010W
MKEKEKVQEKTIQDWLDEYGESHQTPFNKKLHFICVPLILFSLVGLLSYASLGFLIEEYVPLYARFAHAGTLLMIIAISFYYKYSYNLFLGGAVVATITLMGNYYLGLYVSLWQASLIIFVLAWIGQFIGHHHEGKKPSFFDDLKYLLVGPAWILSFLYKKWGIKY